MNESAQLPPGHKPFYPLQEIATLLAIRIGRPDQKMRTSVDKVRKRLLYAVEKGDLHVMAVTNELQLFYAAQVFAWARRKWPDAFGDVSIMQAADASDTLRLSDAAKTWVYPGDLDACHTLLRSAYDDIELLKEELSSAERELARLRPLAERYEENRDKNRHSAKMPRKGGA